MKMNTDNVFEDIKYLKEKYKNLRGPEPTGITMFPDGRWELWWDD